MENVAPVTRAPLSKTAVVSIVAAWIVLLAATHWGSRSPYSYGWAILDVSSERLSGAVVNPDALSVNVVTRFYYDGTMLDWKSAHNLKLPLHSFTSAIGMAFTRSFLLGNYLANAIFAILLAIAAVSFADRYAIPRMITLVTLLTFFSLPMFLDYLGQPMHYMVGLCASFLVILSIVVTVANDERNPWILGLGAMVLALNYDPYVYLASLFAYVLVAARFRRLRDYAIFALVLALPNVLWSQFLKITSNGLMTKYTRQLFIEPIFDGWGEMIATPLDELLQPFVATHIGVHVAMHQIVTMIYWPLVAVCVFLLIRLRPRIATNFVLIALLPLFLFLEQMAAAAWDWELNPRRAIPVVLTFAASWTWCAVRVWPRRGWRSAFVALMAMSMFLGMSDTLLKEPVMAYLRTGQAIRLDPHLPVKVENMRLTKGSMPHLLSDENVQWWDVKSARVQHWGAFIASQAIGALLFVALFWLCARARLLPRWSPHAALIVWALSIGARFV